MVRYRRNRIPGGTFFFTVTLRDRRSSLLVQQVELLREAFRVVRHDQPFQIDAIVVLPDHLHAIWTLPASDADFSGRWKRIKHSFTRNAVRVGVPASKNARGEYDLWQRRFWEHTIRDEADFERCANYIHFNPVKHGLVAAPVDWKLSSIHRYIRGGILPRDWGGANVEAASDFGEPGR